MGQIWNGRNIRIALFAFFCIAGMFLCLIKKGEFEGEGSVRYNTATMSAGVINQSLYDGEQYSTEQVENIQYLLWNLEKNEVVESSSTGRIKNISVVECNGEVSLFFSMNVISGSILQRNDEAGCLIDKKTAFDLFGTVHGTGNLVKWKNKNYIVRGVLETSEEFMLIENSDLQKMYCNMEIQFQNKESNSSMVQIIKKLLSYAILPTECVVIDNSFFITTERFLYLLPSILFGFFLIYRELPYSRFICFVLCLILFFVFISLFQLPFSISDDFIPNKWSDFDFYQIKYKDIVEEMKIMNHSASMYKELYLKKRLDLSIVYGVIGVILLNGEVVVERYKWYCKFNL